jgi:endonuclease-3
MAPGKVPRPRGRTRPRTTRRESAAALRARGLRILGILDRCYPDARCSLAFQTPFQLLVATILSAQCTDARVNLVTRELFRDAGTPEALARLGQAELEERIRSTGFFRNKARSLLGTAAAIRDRFGGNVPSTMEELLTLPGVARKTANVVLGTAFGLAQGVVVDTHVARITRLLGLTRQKDPRKIESDLMSILPEDHWIRFSHQLIQHGRAVCVANRPRCDRCALASECPSARIAG